MGQNNQTVTSGATVPPININGTGCSYSWINDNPAIGLPGNGTGNIPSFTAANTTGKSITANITVIPPPSGYTYIANFGSNSVSVIDNVTNLVVATIPAGKNPTATVVTPDGKQVYVANDNDYTVSVINTAINQVVKTIYVGDIPQQLAISPDGSKIYVPLPITNNITVISTATNSIAGVLPCLPNPYMVAISPDGSFLYTSYGDNNNVITVLDLNTVQFGPSISTGKGYYGLAVSPDNKTLYAANYDQYCFAAIDVASHSVRTVPVTGAPFNIALNSDGSRIYVPGSWNDVTSVFNTANYQLLAVIPGLQAVKGVCISPDDSRAYVVNGASDTVSVIGTATNTVIAQIPVQHLPESFNNFVFGSSACKQHSFTITVNSNPTPVITTSTVTGSILGCVGSPGESPNVAQFTVAGTSLTGDITVTPPPGFDISLTAVGGYSPSLVLKQAGGAVISTTIYVRSSASDPVGPVSGNIQITTAGATADLVAVTGTINALPTVNPVPNQTVNAGASTTPVNFTGTGNTFTWTNDTPGIGLPASGTGNIPSFTAINNGGAPIKATITASPESSTTNCSGTPFIFSITVDASAPSLTVGPVSGSISACFGSPSTIPNVAQFILTGNGLTGNITITASPGFEVSADGNNFSSPVIFIPTNGGAAQTIYVRASASAGKGNISGNIVISSPGVPDQQVTVAGVVGALTSINPINNQSYNNGDSTKPIVFSGTSTNYTWTNNNPLIGLNASGSGNIPSFTATNTSSTPITANITVTPTPTGYAYIPDYAGNVLVINTASNLVIASVPVGQIPIGVAVTPDGSRVYVANSASNNVSVIDASSNKVMATLSTGNGSSPFFIAVSPDGSKAYVANSDIGSVSVINTITNQVVTSIPVGNGPVCIAVSPDGSKLYVVNQTDGTVSVVNAASYAITASIPIGSNPYAEVISPDGKTLYVATQINSSKVYVIDTQSDAIITSIPVGSAAQGIAITPDGAKVYVTGTTTGNVTVIGTATNSIISTIPVGNRPYGIAVSPDGSLVYVINQDDGSISIISTAGNTVTGTITSLLLPLVIGNFVSSGAGCSGAPITFTITINSPAPPVITSSGTLTGLSTIYGTASSSESFTVSATNATAGILVTAPQGFEVSTDNQTFSTTVTAGQAGAISAVPVYIRLAATTVVGNYSGNIVLSIAAAPDVNVNMPLSSVEKTILTVTAPDVTRTYGVPNPAFVPQYLGFVNGDNQSNLTTLPDLTTTATIASPPGNYPIQVTGGSSPNYIINPVGGTLTITPSPSEIVVPNAFTPNGDGINDFWDIKTLVDFPQCLVSVYTRYGSLVFQSRGYPKPWDGTSNGSPVPTGTYYYIINPNQPGFGLLSGFVAVLR